MEELPPLDAVNVVAPEHAAPQGEAPTLSQVENLDGSASTYSYSQYSESVCDGQANAQLAIADAAAAAPSSKAVSSAVPAAPQAAVLIARERRREAEQAWRLHRLKADRVTTLANEVRQKEEELWKLRNDLAACQRDEVELKQLAEQRTTEAEMAEASFPRAHGPSTEQILHRVKIKHAADGGGRVEKRATRGIRDQDL